MSFINYTSNLNNALNTVSPDDVNVVYDLLLDCKKNNNTLYFCGNGGSAGNANHLANDFIYGVAKKTGEGFKVQSLSANSSVLTCLANDVGYQNIYSEQIEVLGAKNDILVCLSGSGNSENILRALEAAKNKKMKTISILGYDGGKAKLLSDHVVHVNINDMQISEDFQLILFHFLMQKLYREYNNA
jgi:D-sedoheptulose 7-phosphate isomerase